MILAVKIYMINERFHADGIIDQCYNCRLIWPDESLRFSPGADIYLCLPCYSPQHYQSYFDEIGAL
jgi:hypothetical protein